MCVQVAGVQVAPSLSVVGQSSQVSQASAFAGNNIMNNPTVSGAGDISHRVPTPPIGSVSSAVPQAVPQAPPPTLAPAPAQVIHVVIYMYSNMSCDAYTQLSVKSLTSTCIDNVHVHIVLFNQQFLIPPPPPHTHTRTESWVPESWATSSTSTSATASHNLDWHHGASRCCKWCPLLVAAFW